MMKKKQRNDKISEASEVISAEVQDNLTDVVEPVAVSGYEFHSRFSPSESLEGMEERMAARIKKVRKMKKNNIFNNPFKNSEN